MKAIRCILAGLAALGLGAGCASAPGGVVWATGSGSTTHDGLQRVRWSDLGALFLKPGAGFQGFHAILLEPLQISPEQPGEPHAGFLPDKTFPPTPDYLEKMQAIYRDSFAREFQGNGFALASQPGPGVLRLSGYALDLVLTARLDPQNAILENQAVQSFGELTLVLDVRDAANGTPLLRAMGRQPIAPDPVRGFSVNSIAANQQAQRDLFDHQALLLRTQIQELEQTPALPPAPAPAR